MKVDQLEKNLFKTLCICITGIILTQTLGINKLTSLLFYLSFPVTFLLWLLTFNKKLKLIDYIVFLILASSIICVGVNCFVNHGILSFGYIKKLIFFCTTIVFLHLANRKKLSKDELRFVFNCLNICSIIFVVMYFLQGENRNIIGDVVSAYLTFKFTNPNLVAMFLMCLFVFQLSMIYTRASKLSKIAHSLLAVLLAFFIFETKARNCQIVMFLFLIFYCLLYISNRKEVKMPKFASTIIGVFPMLFCSIYMLIVNNPLTQKVFSFMATIGKALDSRVKIWEPAFQELFKSPIVGAYYNVSEGTGMSQLHNTHLDIAASYGLITLILVCLFLILLISQNKRINKLRFSYLLCFCATILMGMGEAAFFSGGLGLHIFMGLFIMLAHNDEVDPYVVNYQRIEDIQANLNIVFISNYYNHHQHSLSQALAQHAKSFHFIETEQMPQDRVALGWNDDKQEAYVHHLQFKDDNARKLLDQADVVIVGSASYDWVRYCLKKGKLVLRYSERPLKNGLELKKYIPRFIKWHLQYPYVYPIYLLSASGYALRDYEKFGLFVNRGYKWGYFPETEVYSDVESMIQRKDKTSILWCGRYLDWKHPDDVIVVAKKLKEQGYCFHIDFVGTGEEESKLHQMITQYQLNKYITLHGSMKPSEVRSKMKNTGIYLFTSDAHEGWGAVLNEAMNSGCAVVASHEIGSVPYLIKNNKNALIYRSGDLDDLYNKVKLLLDSPQYQDMIGENAYYAMTSLWNGNEAAKRLVELSSYLLAKEDPSHLFKEGPCSKDESMIHVLCDRLKLKLIYKKVIELIVNHILAGPYLFELKRELLNTVGFELGKNTKVVGPLLCDGTLKVGEDCFIGRDFKVHGDGQVIIGDGCHISSEVSIVLDESMNDYMNHYEVNIGQHSHIGARTTLLHSIHVGSQCRIGACLYIDKNIKDNMVVDGITNNENKGSNHEF